MHYKIYTHNGVLLGHKREWNYVICSNMNGPRDYHSKWTKSEREIQIPYDNHLYVESKIWHKWTYLQNRNRPTDGEKKLMVTKGEKGCRRDLLGVWD